MEFKKFIYNRIYTRLLTGWGPGSAMVCLPHQKTDPGRGVSVMKPPPNMKIDLVFGIEWPNTGIERPWPLDRVTRARRVYLLFIHSLRHKGHHFTSNLIK